jgi:flagellar biosynthetic protein FlhB
MDVEGGIRAIAKTRGAAGRPCAAILLVMLVAGLLGAAATSADRADPVTPDKLKPTSEAEHRQGAGRIFGLDGLMNFAKSLIKVLVTGLIAWFVKPHAAEMAQPGRHGRGGDPADVDADSCVKWCSGWC